MKNQENVCGKEHVVGLISYTEWICLAIVTGLLYMCDAREADCPDMIVQAKSPFGAAVRSKQGTLAATTS